MNEQQRVSDIELEKLALGELEIGRENEVRQRLEKEPGGKERLAQLLVSNEEILKEYPPHLMAVQISEREKSIRPHKSRAWFAIPAIATAAAALALVLIMTPNGMPTPPDEQPEVIILKGSHEPVLFIFRKGKGQEDLLKKGAIVKRGDVLQLKYAARGAKHGTIFSIDGLGAVTLHFPNEPRDSTELKGNGANSLGFSYELDDAPGFERFFFVTSQGPIDVQTVLEAGRKLGPDETGMLLLPNGLNQNHFLLTKKSDK